jgi:tetratricopeptide (TPR) repeat protein
MAAKRVSGKVRLVDVAPTLLEVAGIPVPSQMQGESLLRIAKSSTGEHPVYSRSEFPQRAFGWSALESWRAGKYLYIRSPKPELYDLATDPGATHNLAQSSKGTLDTIAAQLDAFARHFTASGKSAELSSSEMQKLASLGYVGLQKSAGNSTAVTGTDPKDVIATANKTIASLEILSNGNIAKAASALQSLVSSQPNLYLAQFGLGVALAQQQQFAPAIEHLHKAIELQPDSAWANYYIGMSLLKTGDAKTAAVHLEIATTRLPENSEAHALLAQAYEKLGKTEDAKKEKLKAGQKT